MVLPSRLELECLAAPAPQAGASTDFAKGAACWWIARELNPVCPKTPDLQSSAVANAARNPCLVPHRRFERRTPGFVGQCSIQMS